MSWTFACGCFYPVFTTAADILLWYQCSPYLTLQGGLTIRNSPVNYCVFGVILGFLRLQASRTEHLSVSSAQDKHSMLDNSEYIMKASLINPSLIYRHSTVFFQLILTKYISGESRYFLEVNTSFVLKVKLMWIFMNMFFESNGLTNLFYIISF